MRFATKILKREKVERTRKKDKEKRNWKVLRGKTLLVVGPLTVGIVDPIKESCIPDRWI